MRSLAFIVVLVALGGLGALVAHVASGAGAAAPITSPPTTVPETTVSSSTAQSTTIVQTTTIIQTTTVTITVTPRPVFLLTPRDGAVIRSKARRLPRFTWLEANKATYYKFQLYRGTTRILGVFPVRPSYPLAKRWTYKGTRYALKAGRYSWYVWPGFGTRGAETYGALLGSSTFRVVR